MTDTQAVVDHTATINHALNVLTPLMDNLRQTAWHVGDKLIELALNRADTTEVANQFGLKWETLEDYKETAIEFRPEERSYRSFSVHSILRSITDREARFAILNRPGKLTINDANDAVRAWKIEQGLALTQRGPKIGRSLTHGRPLRSLLTKGGCNLDGIKLNAELYTDDRIRITIEHPLMDDVVVVASEGIISVRLAPESDLSSAS
jgi:hypothetical protein